MTTRYDTFPLTTLRYDRTTSSGDGRTTREATDRVASVADRLLRHQALPNPAALAAPVDALLNLDLTSIEQRSTESECRARERQAKAIATVTGSLRTASANCCGIVRDVAETASAIQRIGLLMDADDRTHEPKILQEELRIRLENAELEARLARALRARAEAERPPEPPTPAAPAAYPPPWLFTPPPASPPTAAAVEVEEPTPSWDGNDPLSAEAKLKTILAIHLGTRNDADDPTVAVAATAYLSLLDDGVDPDVARRTVFADVVELIRGKALTHRDLESCNVALRAAREAHERRVSSEGSVTGILGAVRGQR